MAPTNVRLTKSGRFKRCLQATWNIPKENRQNVEYRIKLIQLGNSARNSTRNYDILRPHIKSKNFCNLMPATKYKVVVWAEAGDQAVRSIETPSNVVTTGKCSIISLLTISVLFRSITKCCILLTYMDHWC